MQNSKTPIYQTQAIRECERLAAEKFGVAPGELMQRAGKAAFDYLLKRWPQVKHLTLFCGGGNNGGDGYVVAQLAHQQKIAVHIWQVGDQSKLSAVAKLALQQCAQSGIVTESLHAQADIGYPDLIVDAICGIGVHSRLREEAVLA